MFNLFKVTLGLGLVVFATLLSAKESPILENQPVDNSYTLNGSLVKYQKQFPQIRLPKIDSENKLKNFENVVYRNIGKRNLHIDIYQPKHNSKKIALLLVHGGGWSSGNKALMSPLAQSLSLRGYVTATVEYRLSPEAQYPAAILDIYAAINWLKSQANLYGFEPNKLSILGGSSGGHIASLVAYSAAHNIYLSDSDKLVPSAVIDLDGVLEVASGEGLVAEDKNGKTDSALARWLGGNFRTKTALWREASILQYINAKSPPLLFISSGQNRFKAGFEQTQQQMESFGIQAELIRLNQTPHPFWLFEPWFSEVCEHVDRFLQHHNSTNVITFD
jgi:acetyl esterase